MWQQGAKEDTTLTIQISGKMKIESSTRYFIFTRKNPRPIDFERLVDNAEKLDIYMGYHVTRERNEVLLTGFLVMRGRKSKVSILSRSFPNFLIRPIPGRFDINFHNTDGVYMNKHPFDGLQKRLFE